ncbi:hypothetical protein Anapl_03320 [Anas platyrhynchos]|uniref:Uncharacterized protein n=1 Tax=Anas platyrhynchos TaxID=8839 RepID=R0L302_ANAPL|nr:hypothetical protein Anapl_03320 [Anas platyrhynchos]
MKKNQLSSQVPYNQKRGNLDNSLKNELSHLPLQKKQEGQEFAGVWGHNQKNVHAAYCDNMVMLNGVIWDSDNFHKCSWTELHRKCNITLMTAVQKTCQTIPEQAWTDEEVAQHFEVLKCLFQSPSLTLSTLMLIMIWEEKKGILGGESSINDAVIVKTGISKTYVLGCMDTDDRVTKINTTSLCSIPLKAVGGMLTTLKFHCKQGFWRVDFITSEMHVPKAEIYKWNPALMLVHEMLSKAQKPLRLLQNSLGE